jgi:hypothetical protein
MRAPRRSRTAAACEASRRTSTALSGSSGTSSFELAEEHSAETGEVPLAERGTAGRATSLLEAKYLAEHG